MTTWRGYIQLKNPNLSVKGIPHFCLQFSRNVFDVPAKYGYATEAWQKAQHKHTDALPDVAVPVWFRWTGTVGGIRKNWGHVAVAVPGKGILSDPLIGNPGQLWLNSIRELEEELGSDAAYLGWSEDINDVRVAQEGGSMPTEEEVRELFTKYLKKDPTAAQIKNYTQRPWSVLANNVAGTLRNSLVSESAKVTKAGEKIKKLQGLLDAEAKPLPSGKYLVKE